MRQFDTGELLRALQDNAEEVIIATTTDGTIASWNAAGERLLGYRREEMLGKSIALIFPAESRAEAQTAVDRICGGTASETCEVECLTKDNRRIFFSLMRARILDGAGKPQGVIHVAHDLTARRAAEKEIEDARRHLNDVLDHIPDPIFMKDREHKFIGGNKAFWEMLNGPPENFLGKSDYDFFPKEEADHFWAIDDRVFAGEVITTEEFLTPDPKGVRRTLSTKKASFTNDQQGQFLVGVIRDITALKDVEARLRDYTRKLERSNLELEEVAHIASHDLKEPLRGLIIQASLLKEDNEASLDAAAKQRLGRMVVLAKKMARLIEDLLYYSRIGHAEFAIAQTDLNGIIDEVGTMMSALLREKNGRIVTAKPLPTLLCDRLKTTEVFRNLITNALKYNDKAEKIVEVGLIDAMEGPEGPEQNVLFVRDNGAGIPAEHHQNIFGMFRRLRPEENGDVTQGTGVGLTIVKRIIERGGGRIWLESEVGKGTTFYFTLGCKTD